MKRCGREIVAVPVVCVFFAAAAVLFSQSAFGAPYDFVPSLAHYDGELELGLTHESDENTNNGKGVKTKDMTVVERLRLDTTGYIYHPRFILFTIGGALGLLTEDFESTIGNSRRGTRSADEYNLSAVVLPEHPYNLELYSFRVNPLVKPRYSFVRPFADEKGAIFRYREKPWNVLLSASDDSTSSTISTDTRSYRGNISYYVGPVSNSTGFVHSDSTNSLLMENARDDAFFSNDLILPSLTLNSRIDNDRMRQETPGTAPISDRIVTWTEQMYVQLPWGLSANASNYLQKETRTAEQTASSPEDTVLSNSENAAFTLSHQLYESLRTTYTKNYVSLDTSSGNSRITSDAVGSTYTKKIPSGRLIAGINLGRSDTDITNTPTILDETHFLPVPPALLPIPGSFTLKAQSINESTIMIWVEFAGSLVLMIPTTNYQIQTIGNTLRINVLSLPPSVDPNLSSYKFHVSYMLLPTDVEYRTDIRAANLTFELFDGMLKPFSGYSSNVQDVLSGSLTGGPESSRTETLGVITQKKPFMFQTEYDSVNSRLNPSRSWKNVLEYRDYVAEATNVIARLSIAYNDYLKAIAAPGSSGYTEVVKIADITMQRHFPRNNLDLNFETSYSRTKSFAISSAFTFNTGLVWQIGKLTLNAGASINDVHTSYSSGKQTYTTQYYYFTMSRKLF